MPRNVVLSHVKWITFVRQKKWYFIFGLIAILIMSSLGVSVKGTFFVFALTIIGAFSTYYRKYVKLTFGFETVTLATVLTTVAYGPVIGSIVGLVSAFGAEFIPELIDPSSFFWILSYIPVAFAVHSMNASGVPLFWLGMIATVIQNVIAEPIRIFSGDELMRGMGVLSVGGSTVSNIILFSVVASPLLSLM